MTHQSPRSASQISPRLHQRINLYAIAASAAGVGMVAVSQPAPARIVYTPAHVKIVLNHGEIFFDVNHDGVNDFGFYATTAQTTSGFRELLDVGPAKLRQGNGVLSVHSGRHSCAAALRKGAKVGPGDPFNSNNIVMAFVSTSAGGKDTYFCPWVNRTKPAYLGLKFAIKSKVHFGWARVGGGFLTGYAYETVPRKTIAAGATKGPDVVTVQPATLGRLASGKK